MAENIITNGPGITATSQWLDMGATDSTNIQYISITGITLPNRVYPRTWEESFPTDQLEKRLEELTITYNLFNTGDQEMEPVKDPDEILTHAYGGVELYDTLRGITAEQLKAHLTDMMVSGKSFVDYGKPDFDSRTEEPKYKCAWTAESVKKLVMEITMNVQGKDVKMWMDYEHFRAQQKWQDSIR